MIRSNKFANPFYILLVVAGITFVLTAAAYCVMLVRENRSAVAPLSEASAVHPLMEWMGRHGDTALTVELAVLALGTVGAISTDNFWQRRRAARDKRDHAI